MTKSKSAAAKRNGKSAEIEFVATDESMSPTIRKGDVVKIEPERKIEEGCIVMAQVGGKPILRRYYSDGKGFIEKPEEDGSPRTYCEFCALQADNPKEGDFTRIKKSELKVLGVASAIRTVATPLPMRRTVPSVFRLQEVDNPDFQEPDIQVTNFPRLLSVLSNEWQTMKVEIRLPMYLWLMIADLADDDDDRDDEGKLEHMTIGKVIENIVYCSPTLRMKAINENRWEKELLPSVMSELSESDKLKDRINAGRNY